MRWFRALAGVIFVVVALTGAGFATPIKPTVQEVIKASERQPIKFPPARVGWTTANQPVNFNLTWEQYGPEATARQTQAATIAALTPNPLLVGAIFGCIFLLRMQRVRRRRDIETRPNGEVVTLPERTLEAA